MSLKVVKIKVNILSSKKKMEKICPVSFSTKARACTQVLMRLEAFFIIISVLRALQKMAKLSLMQKQTAKINTKIKKNE